MADKLNFLLPVDFLPESESAVEYASTLARTVGASLHLVHIIEEESPLQKLVLNNGQRDMIRRGAADKLDELAGKHLVHPEINFTTTILQGKVYNKIIYAAREVKADIIFMGRTDSSDMKKNLTGTKTVKKQGPKPLEATAEAVSTLSRAVAELTESVAKTVQTCIEES